MLHALPQSVQVNTTIVPTFDNNGIQCAMFRLRSVPVLSDVLYFFSSIVVLTPNDNFLVVPVLHSVSDERCIRQAAIFTFYFREHR